MPSHSDHRRRVPLMDAVASELEELRNSGRKKTLGRTHSLSPTRVPPCEESSQSSSSDESDPCEHRTEAECARPTGKSRGGFRRRSTFAEEDSNRPPAAEAERPFPPACLALLRSLPGNSRCVDCGEMDPQWASVSYGVMLCLSCSGWHRSLGVRNSFVRSVAMDSWSHAQILTMLEGGNEQLAGFFQRHSLSPTAAAFPAQGGAVDEIVRNRYRTKAALFYREQLSLHVGRVAG
eukprot:CAMPEP_0183309230 /NCGR_PEP_ID=MMETSP0160_2-20130417/24605_1 /TAXON_ID=2839 ORGANISM="Odontella Sinensis, Strain Grunow 1884" /NCGR_SAMPLE_ID=MMETSP0160_2 /ASSEMBLY_ACC=CAM_ASM_000250 /LENGTH=234 /DNA_ID=CAMNT_0025473225 /DNA_START=50 /DNA_END=751 /DNA_ORIENTATION=-